MGIETLGSGIQFIALTSVILVVLTLGTSAWLHLTHPWLVQTLTDHGYIPQPFVRVIALAVPLVEAGVAATMLAGVIVERRLLIYACLVSVTLFTVYASYQYLLVTARRSVPCGCTGGSDIPASAWTLMRTVVLLIASILARQLPEPPNIAESAVLPAILAGVSLTIITWVMPEAVQATVVRSHLWSTHDRAELS